MSRHPRAGESTEQGFVKRWSRRKARGDAPDAAAGPASTGEAGPEQEAGGTGDGGVVRDSESRSGRAEEIKTDHDMPDLDTIDESSNVSDFLSPGVSEALRNQALRRLFRTARFNVIDPLDDYNEDFRNFQVLGDLVTSDMRHRIELEKERAQEADNAASTEEQAAADAVQDRYDDAREEGEPDRAAVDRDEDGGAGTATEDGPNPASDTPSRTRS